MPSHPYLVSTTTLFVRGAYVLSLLAFAVAAAQPSPASKFEAIFGVHQAHAPALSPDGKRVAFGLREKGNVFVALLDLKAAAVIARIQVGVDEYRHYDSFINHRRPQVRDIVWLTPQRFIVVSDLYDIFAVDLDGAKLVPLSNSKSVEWFHTIGHRPPTSSDWVPYQASVGAIRRPARLVGMAPDGSHAHVEAGGSSHFGASDGDEDVSSFQIDVKTGRSRRTGDLSINGRIYYDPDGQPRVYFAMGKFPFRILQRPPDAPIGQWRPIDLQDETRPSEFVSSAQDIIGHRSVPLGFAYDPATVYIASNVGRDTYGVYGLDLRTGRRTEQALEHARFDLISPGTWPYESSLVLDRHRRTLAGVRFQALKTGTAWVDLELQDVQQKLDAKLPDRSVVILNWDEARERFLVHGFHRGDPGSYLIYDKSTDRLQEYLPLVARNDATPQVVCMNWSFRLPDGRSLSGNITRPAGRERVPTVVLFQPRAWMRADPDFLPEAAAFVRLGFAVFEVSGRGSTGFGLDHWLAGRDEFDRRSAEDVFTALDVVGNDAAIETKRVTLFGANFGGWHALRTLQLFPNRVRSAVVFNPVTDVSAWIDGAKSPYPGRKQYHAGLREYFGNNAETLKRLSPLQYPIPAEVPVFVAQTHTSQPRKLRDAIRKANPASRWIDPPAVRDPATEQPTLFAKVESFLRGLPD